MKYRLEYRREQPVKIKIHRTEFKEDTDDAAKRRAEAIMNSWRLIEQICCLNRWSTKLISLVPVNINDTDAEPRFFEESEHL